MKTSRFYSKPDKNLSLSFKINGLGMGSSGPTGNDAVLIQCADADNEIFNQVIFYNSDHNILNSCSLSTNTVYPRLNLAASVRE